MRERPLTIRHLLPGFGAVPLASAQQPRDGMVGAALSLSAVQAGQHARVELWGWAPRSGRVTRACGDGIKTIAAWRWARLPYCDLRYYLPFMLHAATATPVDIVHAHSDPYLLMIRRGRARVLHYNTTPPTDPSPFYQRMVRQADAIICCSEFIRCRFLQTGSYPPDRVFVVHNGVDLSRFANANGDELRRRWGIRADELLILYAGAIAWEKGVIHLVRALQRLRGRTAMRLMVAGASDLWQSPDAPPGRVDRYEQEVQAASEGLPVHWLGSVPHGEMGKVYQAADICVCPSVWDDPHPTVVVEAMAAGRPVIGSAVGGIPETVVAGETGLLIPPGDPAALAAALQQLLAAPDQREAMGRRGRMRAAAHFTWGAAAERIERIYAMALASAVGT